MKSLCPLGRGGGREGLSLPNLSGSDLPEGMNRTHFELQQYYDCVISVEDDMISNSFPVMDVECGYVDKIL